MNRLILEQKLSFLTSERERLDDEIMELKNRLQPKNEREKRLTCEELKAILEYNPETGHFLRLKPGNRHEVGDRAGHLNKCDGYRRINIKYIAFMEHRLAWLYMTGEWPEFSIDHINEIKHDNRWCNLRHVTWLINNVNRSHIKSNNTSGILGVSLHKKSQRWRASISFHSRQIYLGLFSTKEEAAAAYAAASKKYRGFSPDELLH